MHTVAAQHHAPSLPRCVSRIIAPMSIQHHLDRIARLVLAWFVLSLGAAVASPIVNPQTLLMVCSGSGAMKVLVQSDDGSATELGAQGMDCPLCASLSAPPPVATVVVEPVHPLAYALLGMAAAHIAARSASPLPARGPPTL